MDYTQSNLITISRQIFERTTTAHFLKRQINSSRMSRLDIKARVQ